MGCMTRCSAVEMVAMNGVCGQKQGTVSKNMAAGL